MADLASYGNPDRDVEQALIALKKGTQLIKYGRKGKPKFCPFRVSADETTLIWYSHGEERQLKLSKVTRILPGQRTPVFRRYHRPEKEYLSFSLIFNNGDRSLDLICKDKVEVDVWLAGLKALISTGQTTRSRRSRSDISDINDAFSDKSPFASTLDYTPSISSRSSIDYGSDAGYERPSMQGRTSGADGFRISVSSTPSCSSQGSGPDDIESLGDVYVWGEIWSDGAVSDGSDRTVSTKSDVLIPKTLESNVVLDVLQIACGVRHVALVTRQGEVFTWGEESGGRLGHGIEKNFGRPKLVEFLAVINVDFVACGEYHTCAVSTSGDLYSWGDGVHNAGLLGHGSDVSHWIPKRVSGPLEGLQVVSISCGTWHSAVSTSNGKLFTFGDGTFGALGHGDRESVPYPKEVQSLGTHKTIKVSCGVWHTAAIVEVNSPSASNVSSRKLFTWGDGDKYRLGHGNKEACLQPTCVSSLVDYNFFQLACGHNLTVGLTTSGHVFTMGSPSYGQLGNPQSDGKSPCLVQERLVGEFVEDIACGDSHICVLTSRSEVFTWGRGANGRLGHGDLEDRNTPILVEALKDRHVRSISCGSNYTATICVHKWISGTDQSVCSGCRQAFGFTRKRHNCYNCGLVHCHACSSKKALKAALAPTPGKPHRVCDSCYNKLKKAEETGSGPNFTRKSTGSHRITDSVRPSRMSRILLSPTTEPVKYHEVKSGRTGTAADSFSIVRTSQVPGIQQLKDVAFPSSLSALHSTWKPSMSTTPPAPAPPFRLPPSVPSSAASNSRPSSPYRRPSPPRTATPVFSRGVIDSLKKSNELLTQEVSKLQNQLKNLKQKSEKQDAEVRKLQKTVQEATKLASEKSSKCNIAIEIVESITDELKAISENSPPEISESENFKSIQAKAESFLSTAATEASESIFTSLQNNVSSQQSRHSKSASVSEFNVEKLDETEGAAHESNGSSVSNKDGGVQSSTGSGSKSKPAPADGRKEVIEQFEPGVYVTLIQLGNGTKIFKRVKFSKRKFAEQQAEEWWKANKDRLLKKYSASKNITTTSESSTAPSQPSGENGDTAASS
ncbi:hypothetical protein DCAR_0520846 [Daucus carota subsp. sativus]|uniref:Uncharacterized protein n=2 Tax=Daucus carota subsp. sativus TaxID=79200 RepID=A0A161YHA0_DAUCS|nr:PREDICTED: uncharacterized protein LOC108221047 isoform X1 [Daucus carota subsp. sativus]WOH01462.1 hypothetical protein DCAR_0520846 [Daucus carota subsp. sativus]